MILLGRLAERKRSVVTYFVGDSPAWRLERVVRLGGMEVAEDTDKEYGKW